MRLVGESKVDSTTTVGVESGEVQFYSTRLRDIKIMCQVQELSYIPVIKAVHGILYAVEDESPVIAEPQAMMEELILD
uniref:EB1 C-terminal domain-containing protein n=1 Tax=Physcomitrium patens TaxID=3218 RepID=A0A2K1II90_PHYPA|nr:hypothetical protein PHYPA_027685 [Physcomitrium patens]